MKAIYFVLLWFLCTSVAFAEVELNVGAGYGTNGAFFHSQLGWKQLYSVPLMITADLDMGSYDYTEYLNIDLNTSIYYKRFSVGVGWGLQWVDDYSWNAGDTHDTYKEHISQEYYYIKPNIALSFKYMKFSLESHIFFDKSFSVQGDKSPEFSFTASFRNYGVPIAVGSALILFITQGHSLNTGGSGYSSDQGPPQPAHQSPSRSNHEWGDINTEGSVY